MEVLPLNFGCFLLQNGIFSVTRMRVNCQPHMPKGLKKF